MGEAFLVSGFDDGSVRFSWWLETSSGVGGVLETIDSFTTVPRPTPVGGQSMLRRGLRVLKELGKLAP